MRLSASIDEDVLLAAESATKRGEAANLSAWVNEAMRLRLEHDRGLAELAAVIAEFEAEHGEISEAEMDRAARAARSLSVSVRGTRAGEGRATWGPSPSRRRRR